MATRRYFSNVASPAYLVSSLNATDTSFQSSNSLGGSAAPPIGYPASYPFFIVLGAGTPNEEAMRVTGITGSTWTVVRGAGTGYGSVSNAHSAGEVVDHYFLANDADEANAHVTATSAVHGITSTVVGTTDTQTLTNKTLTTPIITGTGGSLTLPAGPDTLVGRATTDTLSNKTLSSPQINTPNIGSGTLTSPTINTPTLTGGTVNPTTLQQGGVQALTTSHSSATSGTHGVTGSIVGTTDTQTLTNKTLTGPVLNGASGSFNNTAGISGAAGISSSGTISAVTFLQSGFSVVSHSVASIRQFFNTSIGSITTTPVTLMTFNTSTSGTETLRISFSCNGLSSTVAGDQFEFRVMSGATQIFSYKSPATIVGSQGITFFTVDTPISGAITYTITCIRASGTGAGTVVAASNAPATGLLEQFV